MDVNISEKTEEPFNGIRFSIKGLNKTVKTGVEKSISETVSKIPEIVNDIGLNPKIADGDSIPADD